jgi:hypothetical protein
VQRSYPNRYLHSNWYRNLELVRTIGMLIALLLIILSIILPSVRT